ncbi:MAG: hypothetical protein N3G22_01090 [Candidatus Micrarchaeota archaeon]|nr:hypothetical protein [Candidatus Micrarchaeota archaeon]
MKFKEKDLTRIVKSRRSGKLSFYCRLLEPEEMLYRIYSIAKKEATYEKAMKYLKLALEEQGNLAKKLALSFVGAMLLGISSINEKNAILKEIDGKAAIKMLKTANYVADKNNLKNEVKLIIKSSYLHETAFSSAEEFFEFSELVLENVAFNCFNIEKMRHESLSAFDVWVSSLPLPARESPKAVDMVSRDIFKLESRLSV